MGQSQCALSRPEKAGQISLEGDSVKAKISYIEVLDAGAPSQPVISATSSIIESNKRRDNQNLVYILQLQMNAHCREEIILKLRVYAGPFLHEGSIAEYGRVLQFHTWKSTSGGRGIILYNMDTQLPDKRYLFKPRSAKDRVSIQSEVDAGRPKPCGILWVDTSSSPQDYPADAHFELDLSVAYCRDGYYKRDEADTDPNYRRTEFSGQRIHLRDEMQLRSIDIKGHLTSHRPASHMISTKTSFENTSANPTNTNDSLHCEEFGNHDDTKIDQELFKGIDDATRISIPGSFNQARLIAVDFQHILEEEQLDGHM